MLTQWSRSRIKGAQVVRGGFDLMSIDTVPLSLLHGPARWALRALAYQGCQVVCFKSFGADPDECPYRVWLEPIAVSQPTHNGRITMGTWIQEWRAFYKACTRWEASNND
jgi:hypothetical protein